MTTTAKRPRKPPTTTRMEYVLEARGGFSNPRRWHVVHAPYATPEEAAGNARSLLEGWQRREHEDTTHGHAPIECRIVTRRVTVETVAVDAVTLDGGRA